MLQPNADIPCIAYLDQNKWIELARAAKFPGRDRGLRSLFEWVCEAVRAGRLALPLTATNIYETHKINDSARRHDLAFVQSVLSRGLVFRGRYKRLELEVATLLAAVHGLPVPDRSSQWFLSDLFFESFAEWGDPRLGTPISGRVVEVIRSRPSQFLYDYLTSTPEDVRTAAVRNFTDGSEQLRRRIEERRALHANESLAMRRRIHGAILVISEIDLIIALANKAGMTWKTASDIGSSLMRRMTTDVPTYHVEREIALRLEAQKRPIEENDFRDMQSFCAALPYADHVIAENHFVNLARQAKLDRKYGTQVSTDLFSLLHAPETSPPQPSGGIR